MTTEELQKLTPKEKRVKIAEARGWKEIHHGIAKHPTRQKRSDVTEGRKAFYNDYDWHEIPDYPGDLNAMHEVEEPLHRNYEASQQYRKELTAIVSKTKHSGCSLEFALLNASAAQRADAFLLSLPDIGTKSGKRASEAFQALADAMPNTIRKWQSNPTIENP